MHAHELRTSSAEIIKGKGKGKGIGTLHLFNKTSSQD
jgi:hypothetical protein